jgi:hypothetical protein
MQQDLQEWTVESPHVRAHVQSLGAMLGPAHFNVGGRTVQPFAVAPWANDPPERVATLPGLLRRLRGEWPCIPFGVPQARRDVPDEWLAGLSEPDDFIDPEPHGTCSNAHWTRTGASEASLILRLDLPPAHPIESLERHITAEPSQAALAVTLKARTRRACQLPIGIHPTFRLPTKPGSAYLDFGHDALTWSFPVAKEPGISVFVPDQRGVPLTHIERQGGEPVDASRLPLAFATEELLLVTNARGTVDLVNTEEGYGVQLAWDPEIFPSCNLWLSNRGRTAYPWNGRFLAVGVEPVCAPFDLGVAHARNSRSPLARAGIPCTREFKPDHDFVTTYKLAVYSTSKA